MKEVINRQTLIISVNLATFVAGPPEIPSQIQTPVNLRFAADELILKALEYNTVTGVDIADVVQIWCSITNDNLIASFPNDASVYQHHDSHFTLCNTFQTGVITFQFQQTKVDNAPFYYNPQPVISSQRTNAGGSNTRGVVSFTIEFVKYSK